MSPSPEFLAFIEAWRAYELAKMHREIIEIVAVHIKPVDAAASLAEGLAVLSKVREASK